MRNSVVLLRQLPILLSRNLCCSRPTLTPSCRWPTKFKRRILQWRVFCASTHIRFHKIWTQEVMVGAYCSLRRVYYSSSSKGAQGRKERGLIEVKISENSRNITNITGERNSLDQLEEDDRARQQSESYSGDSTTTEQRTESKRRVCLRGRILNEVIDALKKEHP